MTYIILGFSQPNISIMRAELGFVCGTKENYYFESEVNSLSKALKFTTRKEADQFIKEHNIECVISYGVDPRSLS